MGNVKPPLEGENKAKWLVGMVWVRLNKREDRYLVRWRYDNIFHNPRCKLGQFEAANKTTYECLMATLPQWSEMYIWTERSYSNGIFKSPFPSRSCSLLRNWPFLPFSFLPLSLPLSLSTCISSNPISVHPKLCLQHHLFSRDYPVPDKLFLEHLDSVCKSTRIAERVSDRRKSSTKLDMCCV